MKRVAVVAAPLLLLSACTIQGVVIAPSCEPNQRLGIVAQAVPGASAVPCVADLPAGWSAGGADVRSGTAEFWLRSDRAGDRAARVTLTESCDTTDAVRLDDGRDDTTGERFESQTTKAGRVHRVVYDVFDGGCVTTWLDLPVETANALSNEVDSIVALYDREALRAELRDRSGVDIGAAG